MVKKIQINMSNKLFYMFVTVGLMILSVVVVYAYNSGAVPSVMGHSISELAPPAGCLSGQVLGWSGTSWQCVDNEGGTVEEGCPEGYESFTNQISESCILKDDWSESGSLSGELVGNYYAWAKPYSINTDTRIYNGKRQVKITSCHVMGNDCTSGWSDDIASCIASVQDVYQYGCMAVVADRYKVNLWVGNTYFDQKDVIATKYFGPGTIDTIVKYYPPYNSVGTGVDVPIREHKGSCKLNSDTKTCELSSWPGKCSSDKKNCGCDTGYRMVERKDLLPSWHSHHYECVKN